ncbi:MAG: hypothetical protein AAF696_15910 [Bacteroidota bacterium]
MTTKIIAVDERSRKNAETVIALYEETIKGKHPLQAVEKYKDKHQIRIINKL